MARIHSVSFRVFLSVVFSLAAFSAIPAFAEIQTSGDVVPNTDPTMWDEDTTVYIGKTDEGELSITDGSEVENLRAYLGYENGSIGVATISGAGSTWLSRFLYVGENGYGELSIEEGGSMVCNFSSYIGSGVGSVGVVTVDGAGSKWTNSRRLYVGNAGEGTLNISNGGQVSSEDFTIGYGNSTGSVSVDGEASMLTSKSLIVGDGRSGTLNITHGGVVDTEFSVIGTGLGLEPNGLVIVDGAGSTWNNTGDLSIGSLPTFSTTDDPLLPTYTNSVSSSSSPRPFYSKGELRITNGGVVNSSDGGIGDGGLGVATVDGVGSVWNSTGDLSVGQSGKGTLNILHGGQVDVQGNTWLARYARGEGEIHFDEGTLSTGSLLTGLEQLTGTGTINTHGLVSDVDLVFDSDDDFSRVITCDSLPGQNVTIHLDVDGQGMLGAGGTGYGSLTIREGMDVFSAGGLLGYQAGSTGIATVDGLGSTWTMLGSLTVGDYGTGMLKIINGGKVVTTSYSEIGTGSVSMGEVTVDGVGSTWICYDSIRVGGNKGGEGNGVLNITRGGSVVSNGGVVGEGQVGAVNVDGVGSMWMNTADLSVGSFLGRPATLNITHGGSVSNLNGRIAKGEVVVDGVGSKWTNRGRLSVGNIGGNGLLQITHGGQVYSKEGTVGYYSAGVVTVDGAGSKWINSGDLSVGDTGTGDSRLNITNGGWVSDENGYIGRHSSDGWYITLNEGGTILGSESNSIPIDTISFPIGEVVILPWGSSNGVVTVKGAGSTWENENELFVGYEGRGVLNIFDGGLVTAKTLTIDFSGKGESSIHMASGGMLAVFGEMNLLNASFLDLVQGSDDIRYWNGTAWAHISEATYGVDYTLDYFATGDLAGYSVLTVMVTAVPEPTTLSLLGMGTLALIRKRR